LYAVTYEKKEGKFEVVVMDLQGNVLKRSFVFPKAPGDREVYGFSLFSTAYDIAGDKIYHLVENEETERWELHVEAI
jgi:hypothetical protein